MLRGTRSVSWPVREAWLAHLDIVAVAGMVYRVEERLIV
jgi:hypothetical protein